MFGRRNKDDWFRTLADTTTTAIVVHQEGTIVYSNKATSLITGYANNELLQSISIWDIAHPDFRDIVKQRALARQTGDYAPSKYELKILCKDGSTKWLDFTAGVVDWKGKPAVLATAFDITQHKLSMEKLGFHHQLWRQVAEISTAFINASQDSINDKIDEMLRKCGVFLNVDRTFLIQFSPDEQYLSNTHEWCAEDVVSAKDSMQNIPVHATDWISRHVTNRKELFFEDDGSMPGSFASEKSLFKRQQAQTVLAIPLINKNRLLGYFGFDSGKRILKTDNAKSEMIKILGNILAEALARNQFEQDIKEAKKQAELGSQAKGRFLANMSHELRTPLNGVIGFTELMRKTPLCDTQQQYVDNAIHSAKTLKSVIDDILDFSKIEAGKMDLHPTITDIVSLSEQTLEILRLEANKKHLKLLLNLQPDMPRFALIDPLRLKQILLNLLSNAIKFTDYGAAELMLTFQTNTDKKGTYHFSVKDTGIGISEKEQKQLFSFFSQADNSATRKYGGTGLGLAICQMLAEKMGSYIKLESKPGKGSTFRFSIKTDFWHNTPAEMPDTATKTKIDTGLQTIKPNILIAEDNSANLLLTKTLLLTIWPEASILEAHNGKEAVEMNEQQAVDLILMDVQMPGMDGLEATRTIRQRETEADTHTSVPIIALTAGVIKEEKEKCLTSGMNDFLAKPLNEQSLKEIVSAFLKTNTSTNQATMKKPEREALQHFNMKELQERTELSREILLPMAEISMSTLNTYLQSLDTAIQEGNGTEIKSLAHTIKGLALNMSFGRMTDLAKSMESQSNQNLQRVQELFQEMKEEQKIVRELIKNT